METKVEPNKLRALFHSGRVVFGVYIFIPSVAMVDIVAGAGFDYVLLDSEHVPHSSELLENMVRAAENARIPTLVRVYPDPCAVARVLDMGADGIFFSHCSSKQDAEDLVSMCRLPPLGIRESVPTSREGRYQLMPEEEYIRQANQKVVAVYITSKKALEHAEEIINVPGIDAVAIGPDKLTTSLGVSRNDPVFEEAVRHVFKLAKAAGVSPMYTATTPKMVEESLRKYKDHRIFWMGADAGLISRSLQALVQGSRELAAQVVKE